MSSGAALSHLSESILAFARTVPVFAPSQIQTLESSNIVLSACHSLVTAGLLEQVRAGTRGNFSQLITYKESLFKLKTNDTNRTSNSLSENKDRLENKYK